MGGEHWNRVIVETHTAAESAKRRDRRVWGYVWRSLSSFFRGESCACAAFKMGIIILKKRKMPSLLLHSPCGQVWRKKTRGRLNLKLKGGRRSLQGQCIRVRVREIQPHLPVVLASATSQRGRRKGCRSSWLCCTPFSLLHVWRVGGLAPFPSLLVPSLVRRNQNTESLGVARRTSLRSS